MNTSLSKTVDELGYRKIVDELGYLRAEISRLQDDAKKLESILKESGRDDVDGALFHATVSTLERSTVNWKAVAAKFNPSRQLVTANTKHTEFQQVRVYARKKVAA